MTNSVTSIACTIASAWDAFPICAANNVTSIYECCDLGTKQYEEDICLFKDVESRDFSINCCRNDEGQPLLLCDGRPCHLFLTKICCPGGDENKILPFSAENDLDPEPRVILYLLIISWLFLGVTAAADTFMEGVEVITSTQRSIKVIVDGEEREIEVQTWNDTVANLTLMALGSSAPEILLSIVELFSNQFYSGVLGPSTIVGSASFNLFLITAICISALPDGEVHYIKDMNVFCITAVTSVFAYIWIVIIVSVISKDRIERWEAIVTFGFAIVLIVLAYLADIGKIDFGLNRISTDKVAPEEASKTALERMEEAQKPSEEKEFADLQAIANVKQNPAEAEAAILSMVQQKYLENPDMDEREFVAELRNDVREKTRASQVSQKNTRASYRSQACKQITRRNSEDLELSGMLGDAYKFVQGGCSDDVSECAVFEFKQSNYSCLEGDGELILTVLRIGELDKTVKLPYFTEDGDAKAGHKYVQTSGILIFEPGVEELPLPVPIIDNDIHEPDMYFTTHITSPVFLNPEDKNAFTLKLGRNRSAKCLIIDDDVPGVLKFDTQELIQGTSSRNLRLKIKREVCGAIVGCDYCTIGQSAKADIDFVTTRGQLELLKGASEFIIEIPIIDTGSQKAATSFQVVLSKPTGGVEFEASDGTLTTKQINHVLSIYPPPSRDAITGLFSKMVSKVGVGNGSEWRQAWGNQFYECLWVNGSREEQADAGCVDWFFHIITFIFKIICAFSPPTSIGGGWPCFISSLIFIAGFTALINDIGSLIGCCFSISDHITAITIVAIGTSVPDTTASRLAAISDQYADNSIGNITGSNSVNVFLGLGISWTIGAFYWHGRDTQEWRERYEMEINAETMDAGGFIVPQGALVFNVLIFCIGAIFTLSLLAYRRKRVGGELGGPKKQAHMHSGVLVLTWLFYVILASYFAVLDQNEKMKLYTTSGPT